MKTNFLSIKILDSMYNQQKTIKMPLVSIWALWLKNTKPHLYGHKGRFDHCYSLKKHFSGKLSRRNDRKALYKHRDFVIKKYQATSLRLQRAFWSFLIARKRNFVDQKPLENVIFDKLQNIHWDALSKSGNQSLLSDF